MITCMECGFVSSRLQWTHFKFKCTGRFKNGKEYQKVYPGALLVSPELATKTAITLENFIKKYGQAEGQSRWDQYRSKQAYTNTYEHKKSTLGWTEEEFKDYNSSRATTVRNLIKRHGEDEGLRRWEQYCDRQKITKSKDYYVQKYGDEAWEALCKKKADSSDPEAVAAKHGITVDEAVRLISARGKRGSDPFYIADKRGITVDEAIGLLAARWRNGSKVEMRFTTLLEQHLGELLEHTSARKPFGKWNAAGSVVYDIKHRDVIIEFNGDYWHANPKIYAAEATLRGMTASQIWEKDNRKKRIAEECGYRFLTVWESDFLNNETGTIERVVEWIRNGRK